MNAPNPNSKVLEFMRRYGKACRENNVAELRALHHIAYTRLVGVCAFSGTARGLS
jgi:hypothetical protein